MCKRFLPGRGPDSIWKPLGPCFLLCPLCPQTTTGCFWWGEWHERTASGAGGDVTRPFLLTFALGTWSSLGPGKRLFRKWLLGSAAVVPHFSCYLPSLGDMVGSSPLLHYWSLELDHRGRIYTMKIGKCCTSELCYFESWFTNTPPPREMGTVACPDDTPRPIKLESLCMEPSHEAC